MMKVDCLIFGQGLAGSAFVQQCILEGKSVFVVKDPSFKSASMVAAGLYNPLSGQKLHLPKKGDLLFDRLLPFYQAAEAWLGEKLIHPRMIYRAFSNEVQKKYFFEQATELDYGKWFQLNDGLENKANDLLNNEHNGIEVKEGGYLDIPLYLQAVERLLMNENKILFECFDEQALQKNDSCYSYKGISAENVLFAMGVGFKTNTWFNWLPILGLKGDVFELTFDKHAFNFILNKELFVLPITNKRYKAGSTYRRQFEDDLPDSLGENMLKEGLSQMLKIPFTVLKHESAIRPTAGDHHPIVGVHPVEKNIFCLNGLGSKGVTLAPYVVEQLFQSMFFNKEIESQLNISRFYSLFYKKNYQSKN